MSLIPNFSQLARLVLIYHLDGLIKPFSGAVHLSVEAHGGGGVTKASLFQKHLGIKELLMNTTLDIHHDLDCFDDRFGDILPVFRSKRGQLRKTEGLQLLLHQGLLVNGHPSQRNVIAEL